MPASETTCPACHDELFTAEFGCKKCGHGRASFFAGHSREFGVATFFAVCSVGVGALFTFGRYTDVPGVGPIFNLAFIAVGAVLAAVGVWFLGRPSGVAFAQTQTDAWGDSHITGPSKLATGRQLRQSGIAFLAFGFASVVLGVFLG